MRYSPRSSYIKLRCARPCQHSVFGYSRGVGVAGSGFNPGLVLFLITCEDNMGKLCRRWRLHSRRAALVFTANGYVTDKLGSSRRGDGRRIRFPRKVRTTGPRRPTVWDHNKLSPLGVAGAGRMSRPTLGAIPGRLMVGCPGYLRLHPPLMKRGDGCSRASDTSRATL